MSAGPSILAQLWEELDGIMDRLMAPGQEAEDGRDPGRAEGVAYCIAVMQFAPRPADINAIRAQAVERWEERNAEEE